MQYLTIQKNRMIFNSIIINYEFSLVNIQFPNMTRAFATKFKFSIFFLTKNGVFAGLESLADSISSEMVNYIKASSPFSV